MGTLPVAMLLVAMLVAGCAASATNPDPPAGPASPPRVVLVAAGDIACAPDREVRSDACAQEATARIVESLRPDAVLALGDTQYEDATPAKYVSYDRSWGRFLDITHPVIGNHEYESGSPDGYFGYFGDRAGKPGDGWYSTDVGDWRIIVLNSECAQVGGCGPESPQGRWLARELAAGTPRCTLAAWHRARFSSGNHHGNDATVAPLWAQLQAAGVDVVLTGHEHDYERFAPQDADGRADPAGIVQFVVGTGGRSLRGFADPVANSEVRWSQSFGVLALTLRPDGYDWRFAGLPGTPEVDSGSASCA